MTILIEKSQAIMSDSFCFKGDYCKGIDLKNNTITFYSVLKYIIV